MSLAIDRIDQLERAVANLQERVATTEYVLSQALYAALKEQKDADFLLSSFQSAFIKKLDEHEDDELKQTCLDSAERIFLRTLNTLKVDNNFVSRSN